MIYKGMVKFEMNKEGEEIENDDDMEKKEEMMMVKRVKELMKMMEYWGS